jgi:exodeoxyribonuclease VII small subunit
MADIKAKAASKQTPAEESPSKTIEAEIGELQKIVAQLEENKDDLEAALILYERGVELSTSIRNRIADVETKIEMIAKRGQKQS